MTPNQVTTTIETVLGEIPFEPPVSADYCRVVRDALRKRLHGYTLEVYHRYTDLVVMATLDKVNCKSVFPLV